MDNLLFALHVNEKDNVATVFSNEVRANSTVLVKSRQGNERRIKVLQDVPYGHKVAVRDIAKGDLIIKYGEEIGAATENIVLGEYVHIHNVESLRGRGDWGE